MREYVKNKKYNKWKNGIDEAKRKTLLIVKCPYCEKDTSYSTCQELVDVGTKQYITCEECDKSFYASLSVEIQTIQY